MNKGKYKVWVDVVAMGLLVAALVTGFVLHRDVWHLHWYGDVELWEWHEGVGLALCVLVGVHGVQHSFWFKNYSKLPPERKRVTTILLALGLIVAVSGIILMCGSRSEVVSHIHYICAILFAIFGIGHVAKRWKIFRALW